MTGDQCLDDSVIAELRDLGAEVRFKPLWIEDLVDVAEIAPAGPSAQPSRWPSPRPAAGVE